MIGKHSSLTTVAIIAVVAFFTGCNYSNTEAQNRKKTLTSAATAKSILGNPDYLAFSYGGYRQNTRTKQPTIDQLVEDMRILSAMGVKIVRTYNAQQFDQAANLLQAIRQLKNEDPSFEMYVMLGAWIDCEGAWSDDRNHETGNVANNTAEVAAAVELCNQYPDIVKVIAVGNEAMVHWATQYFVHPRVILKWVNHLQELKATNRLPADVWITSSDNYESWGGGAAEYRTDDLAALIKAVDYVSLHTYPFHESHYDPEFWGARPEEASLSTLERADAAILRAKAHAMSQYQGAADYIKRLGIDKPIHIGETGWASVSGSSYGADGSQAADEYKAKGYYEAMRDWTKVARMSCFYFEAFDECWKDSGSESGSENHFGLINLKGQAKFALWEQVDAGVFKGLTRDGNPITKTFGGDIDALQQSVLKIPLLTELGILTLSTVNEQRDPGQPVSESKYIVCHQTMIPTDKGEMTYPSAPIKLNTWEGTCNMEMSKAGVIHVTTSSVADGWWGCGLEIQSDESGENLTKFKTGRLHFEMRGDTQSSFNVGFQSGKFSAGNQVNNFMTFGPDKKLELTPDWTSHSFAIEQLNKGADLTNVTGVFYFHGENGGDGKQIDLRNVFYSKE